MTKRGSPFGFSQIRGSEAHKTLYMTRVRVGPVRFHFFHRGDQDQDCHDHPWDFWTFPLRSYVEEVTVLVPGKEPTKHMNVVKAFRLHRRPATYCHRVIGLWAGNNFTPKTKPGTIPTIVFRGRTRRKWGFVRRDHYGVWCWTHWKKYVYEGGSEAPCDE